MFKRTDDINEVSKKKYKQFSPNTQYDLWWKMCNQHCFDQNAKQKNPIKPSKQCTVSYIHSILQELLHLHSLPRLAA